MLTGGEEEVGNISHVSVDKAVIETAKARVKGVEATCIAATKFSVAVAMKANRSGAPENVLNHRKTEPTAQAIIRTAHSVQITDGKG